MEHTIEDQIMGKPISVEGDLTAIGGVIVPDQSFVRINGLPIITLGCVVLPHNGPPHDAGGAIITGSPFVRINGVPVSGEGDLASCGDPIVAITQTFVFA